MKPKKEAAAERLSRFDVKLSHQRLMIMDYMLNHYTHPSADTVYQEMLTQIPTLSKTTVYNTLRTLARHGALAELNIDERTLHFDGNIEPHVHFICKGCYEIFDVPLSAVGTGLPIPRIKGFVVSESQLYLKGLCKSCAGKKGKDT